MAPDVEDANSKLVDVVTVDVDDVDRVGNSLCAMFYSYSLSALV